MNQYLLFRSGPYRLLLALEQVVEIGDATATRAGSAGGFRQWRGRSLPVLDLAGYLGVTGADRAQQIVIGADDALHLVEVDHVEGLVELAEPCFAQLADLSPGLGALVDAVATAADGDSCLLRLRQPLAWRGGLAAPADAPATETSS
jgi:chemotaxis signal transduction protein